MASFSSYFAFRLNCASDFEFLVLVVRVFHVLIALNSIKKKLVLSGSYPTPRHSKLVFRSSLVFMNVRVFD